MRTKGTGTISINRVSSNKPPYHYISITLVDEKSGCEFARVEMSVEAFGHTVTGLSYQPCTFELHSDNVGMIHEHKTVFVPANCMNIRTDADKKKAVKQYETDGWAAHLRDVGNMHLYAIVADEPGFNVGFSRFVPDKGTGQ